MCMTLRKKIQEKNFWYCSNEGAKTDSEGRQQNILVQLLHSLSKVDSLPFPKRLVSRTISSVENVIENTRRTLNL